MSATTYPKRLIEVDLPIREISAEGAREKATRRGNISTLHLWWARRPLAACRSVILASLLIDPADPACPPLFLKDVQRLLNDLRSRVGGPVVAKEGLGLRAALLDLVRLLANHERASDPFLLGIARALILAAHRALHPGSAELPLVADPFAGGGTVPFEALRLGADAFASDLSPVSVVMNRVLLEAAPKFGDELRERALEAAREVRERAAAELESFYPPSPSGRSQIAYIWARWVTCEGPSCGARIPLSRSLWLMRRATKRVGLRLRYEGPNPEFDLLESPAAASKMEGTIRQGAATCPSCGFTQKVDRLRAQLCSRRGGSRDAILLAIAETTPGEQGRSFRLPSKADLDAIRRSASELERRLAAHTGPLGLLPDEPIPQERVWKNNPVRVHLYGMTTWADLFSPRQALALITISRHIRDVAAELSQKAETPGLADAVGAFLALAHDRQLDHLNALCTWNPIEPKLQHLFGRQALPFVWDFAEANPFGGSVGDWMHCVESAIGALEATRVLPRAATVRASSATEHPLPDDVVDALVTDPPYYDAVPYATLADFFYVWLKRSLPSSYAGDFSDQLGPKAIECVVDEAKGKDSAFFERTMHLAMVEGRRITRPHGIAVVVFAHKTTAGWESLLQAILSAGWTVTASWPINTEMGTRLRARDSAALGSSIHLVLRPRETPGGALDNDSTGSWREIITALPVRLREWLPRLAAEGIVGADAIFACIGPALELYSRYARVEKASGDPVTLKDYLEQIWAAVAREALSMMFEGADASGLEEDARLTAMWLWTLNAPAAASANATTDSDDDDSAADNAEAEPDGTPRSSSAGFGMEFDAARKIAQGLGAHLDKLTNVVEVDGDKARLLSVAERAKVLFTKHDTSKDDAAPKAKGKGKPTKKQLGLFAEIEAAERQGLLGDAGVPSVGETTLDRVHQTMILFGAGRSEALKRFVVEEGVGRDTRFWKLAQSLSALYPAGSDEKRWVDGVLARKKSLGF